MYICIYAYVLNIYTYTYMYTHILLVVSLENTNRIVATYCSPEPLRLNMQMDNG